MPSFNLLGQSLLTGVFVGGLYALLGLGLSLSWRFLRNINVAHFAFIFLSAYLAYQLVSVQGMNPLLTLLILVPLFFVVGVVLQAIFDRFEVDEFASMLVTFGLMVIVETGIQWIWTADFRKLESWYGHAKFKVGPLFVPVAELLAFLVAVAIAVGVWAWLRYTFVGKAMRASADNADIAAAFGVRHRQLALLISGVACAISAVAGVFIALIGVLSPSQIYASIGVVFAIVMLGGLGRPMGILGAGLIIGVSEELTKAIAAPSWAPLVSFGLLILILILRPNRV